MSMSQRYQKVLVTVAMGFRTEEDVKKNGLYRFTKEEEKELISYIKLLFNKNKSVLALKVKPTGYRSEHHILDSLDKLNSFINDLDNLYGDNNEIWIVSSSVLECWRCRIYLSTSELKETIEMAYSYDDHILDHIESSNDVPYICYYKKNNKYYVSKGNLSSDRINETNSIINDILLKYSDILKRVKEDLNFIGIDGISLDVLVNNGYDFHDFDVEYDNVKKVIDYYLPQIKCR